MNLFSRFQSPSAIVFGITVTLCFSWLIFGLALFGLFSTLLVSGLVILFLVSLLFIYIYLFRTHDWHRFFLFTLLSMLALGVSLSRDPSIFSGRDQGSIAEAAYQLATNGQLAFTNNAIQTFFGIYGSGTALNFPGFSYTETGHLISQFPLGYTSWLAAFVTLFGLPGYAIGNSILFLLFGWGLFELLALRVRQSTALGGTFLGTLAFLPLWILTYTLSENFAGVLFVFLALAFLALIANPHPRTIFITLLIGSFFPFVRIEGFAFFALVLGFIFWKKELRKLLLNFPPKYLISMTLLWILLFLRDFFMNLPFYKMIGKALLKRFHENPSFEGSVLDRGVEGLGLIFSHYGLLILFVGALLAALFLFRSRERSSLWILFLAAPTLVYLLAPSITPDHPWMLRRFYFSLYPTAIFLITIGISVWSSSQPNSFLRVSQKALITLGILFVFQAGSVISLFRVTENPKLLDATTSFGAQFEKNDLILIDRESSGDPYTLLSGPLSFLLEKQAVYFFNPLDFSRIDHAKFNKIYLLTPGESLGRYTEILGDKLTPLETVTFTTQKIVAPKSFFALPQSQTKDTVNILFEVVP